MNTIKKLLLMVAVVSCGSTWASVEITGFTVSEAAGTGTWDVTVTPAGEGAASEGIYYMLDYQTRDGSAEDQNGDNDYTSKSGTLDFSGGLTQQITVNITQDTKIEGDENFYVDLFEVVEQPEAEGAAGIPAPVVTGTGNIIDDDIALLVEVQFEGGAGSPVDLVLDCGGNGTIDDSTKTTAGGQATFEVYNFVEPLDCTAVPVAPPAGLTLVSSDCDPGMDEDDTQCLIVFGPTRATFRVSKIFADGNNVDEVEVSIDCNTGLILDQDKDLADGDWVEFVVTDFTEGVLACTITEDGQAGYSGEYDNVSRGNIISDVNCDYPAESIGGLSAHECVITNTPDPVEINVYKDWVFSGNSEPDIDTFIVIELGCSAPIVGIDCPILGPASDDSPYEGTAGIGFYPYYEICLGSTGLNDVGFFAKVVPEFPNTECTITEYVFDQAIEQDNGCGTFTISVGNGRNCTITNTVFFEGIPTLSQYGMALMALLMLGVGFVSFRRFS